MYWREYLVVVAGSHIQAVQKAFMFHIRWSRVVNGVDFS